jgi:hypothetical protein
LTFRAIPLLGRLVELIADAACQDYETRLDEERAALRDEDGPT